MNLPDLERGFRALAKRLGEQAADAGPKEGDANPAAQLTAAIVLARMSNAVELAANDLDDQIRKQYGLGPRDRGGEDGDGSK